MVRRRYIPIQGVRSALHMYWQTSWEKVVNSLALSAKYHGRLEKLMIVISS